MSVGRCGLACEVCVYFNRECLGCEKENRIKNVCIIFKCTEIKNIKCCLRCPDYPCRLMRGLSKAYCPAYTMIKFPP